MARKLRLTLESFAKIAHAEGKGEDVVVDDVKKVFEDIGVASYYFVAGRGESGGRVVGIIHHDHMTGSLSYLGWSEDGSVIEYSLTAASPHTVRKKLARLRKRIQ